MVKNQASGVPRWAVLLWATLGIQSLTYCSGKTETMGGGSGSTSREGNTSSEGGSTSNQGNTSSQRCIDDPCGPGCGLACGGTAGEGGSAGVGGFPPLGFSGHTSGCASFPCLPGCGSFSSPEWGGPGGGGSGNAGGAEHGDGGATEGGAGLGDGGAPDSQFRRAPSVQACYPLAGYEPDPCLPSDDSLLSWLQGIPQACDASVTGEPTVQSSPAGRKCCYSIICRELAE